MKTRERLLFMTIGGLLVLAGMIVGQFVFSPVQAQAGAQDATFKTVRCEELIVGNSLNSGTVIIDASTGFGTVYTSNASGEVVTVLGAGDDGDGIILTRSNTGKTLVTLSGVESGGGLISVNNTHGVKVVNIQANKNKDGAIGLFNRYGDLGWSKIGKR